MVRNTEYVVSEVNLASALAFQRSSATPKIDDGCIYVSQVDTQKAIDTLNALTGDISTARTDLIYSFLERLLDNRLCESFDVGLAWQALNNAIDRKPEGSSF